MQSVHRILNPAIFYKVKAGRVFNTVYSCDRRKDLCRSNIFTNIFERSLNTSHRQFQNSQNSKFHFSGDKKSTVYYTIALGVLVVGFSYAAVPLYRIFCQAYSYGGTTAAGHDASKVESIKPNRLRVLKIKFNADTAASLTWNFRPQQSEIKVALGETALAFYTARNPTDRPVDGISTYNVIPFEAGQYFNKIQCFCFEEQRLNPNEEVDLPVFFYIDPEFGEDPRMENVETLTLSYTFFEAKEASKLNKPAYAK